MEKNSLTEKFAKSRRQPGIEVDNELKIDIHCEKLLKRASKVASIIYQIRAFYNNNQPYEFYKTYIQPIYQFEVKIYGAANKSLLTRIEKEQRMTFRKIFKLKKMKVVLRLLKKN